MGSRNSHHEHEDWSVFISRCKIKRDRVCATVPYISSDDNKVKFRSQSFRIDIHGRDKAFILARAARDEMKKAPDVQEYIKQKLPPSYENYRARSEYANKKDTAYPDITGVYLHITFRKNGRMCLGIVGYMGAHVKRIYKSCEVGTIEDALRDICQQRTDALGILFPSDQAIKSTILLMEKKIAEADLKKRERHSTKT